MKTKIVLSALVLFALCCLLSAVNCLAAVPSLINYQGVLKDSLGVPYNGNATMAFSIWDDSIGGNKLWEEIWLTLSVSHGLFHVLLGSDTAIPDSVFRQPSAWLEVLVNGTTLSPRRRIVSAGYAYTASFADTAEYARNAPVASDGDWVMDGDDVYREQGRVGIGTSNPEHELDVTGTARFEGLHMPTGAADGYVLTSDSSGAGAWQPPSAVFGCLRYITSDTVGVYTTSEDWTTKRSYTIPAGTVSQGIIVIFGNRYQGHFCYPDGTFFWTSYIRITANSVTKGTSQASAYTESGPGLTVDRRSGLSEVHFLAITDVDWGVEQIINLDMKRSGSCAAGTAFNDSWLILGF